MTFLIVAGVLYLMIDEQPIEANGQNLQLAFDPLFKKYAKESGLDDVFKDSWKILKAFSMKESGLGWWPGGLMPSVARGLANPSDIEGSKSSDGKSWGLMQMILPTARDYDSSATAEKLNNPEYSIRLAAKHVVWLTKQFPSSEPRYLEWIVKSYNQGRGNTAKERRGEIDGYTGTYWPDFMGHYTKL